MTFTRMDHTARDLLGSAIVPLRGSRESVWVVRVRKEFISLANGGPCSVPSEGLRGRCFASQTPGPSVSARRGREGGGAAVQSHSASRPAGSCPGPATAGLLPSRRVPLHRPERPQSRGFHGPHLPVCSCEMYCAPSEHHGFPFLVTLCASGFGLSIPASHFHREKKLKTLFRSKNYCSVIDCLAWT